MIESWKLLLVTVILLTAVGLAQDEPVVAGKIYPVDESHLDPSFAEFKAELLQAIETQDREFLRGALGEVRFSAYSLPADRAMADFDRNDGASWKALYELLSMGVKQLEDGRFYAPYVSYVIGFELRGFHDIKNMVIIDKDVELHAEPKPEAPVIALLSYDIVEFDRNESHSGWLKITTIPDGQTGYIRNEYGYAVDNTRVVFTKQDGAWKLTHMQTGL